MDAEVVVVGGGIGGLTVAALLAHRGVNVCLLERESSVGGCAASFEKFGYRFESGYGLYAGWEANEIHDRVFAELPVDAPEVRQLEPSYTVHLPDNSEISLSRNRSRFEEDLRAVFPECAEAALSFYRKLTQINSTLRRALRNQPDFLSASMARRAYALASEPAVAAQILKATNHTTLEYLDGLSPRFRRFVDLQLTAQTQGASSEVPYLRAAMALDIPLEGVFAIKGGAQALADRLAESITKSGGRIRLDTPVLRLAYDVQGAATGADLLSGETVSASRAIISNLTIWDTYGKLIGLNRTPTHVRQQLKACQSWGAYLVYLGVEDEVVATLPSTHLLALTDWRDELAYDPEDQILIAAAPDWDSRAPAGKRAVTVHSFTDVNEWFTFHTDETEREELDRQALDRVWQMLHGLVPELLTNAEVIETATPRTFYEQTRRKLGMVGGIIPSRDAGFWQSQPQHQTSVPNLYIVSDTTASNGLAGLTNAALVLANTLTSAG